MKILIVIDQFDNSNNGTTISARRFTKGLQSAGNEVYVVSTGDKKDEYKFNLKELPLPPGISHIVKSQGMSFAIPNTEVLEKAISSVDIVHFYMPFLYLNQDLKYVKNYIFHILLHFMYSLKILHILLVLELIQK